MEKILRITTTLALAYTMIFMAPTNAKPIHAGWYCRYPGQHTGWVCPGLAPVADALGWVPDTHPSNLCGGGFYIPVNITAHQSPRPVESAPTTFSAERRGWIHLNKQQEATLRGNVIVNQPGRRLRADMAHIYRSKETGKVQRITLHGNVHYLEANRQLVGRGANLDLKHNHTTLWHTLYQIAPRLLMLFANAGDPHAGWGSAQHVFRDSRGDLYMKNATYTTCSPKANNWHIKARDLKIDRQTQLVTAHDARFYVNNLPVLYTPYLSFSLHHERKSGFLFPAVSINRRNGLDLTLPYYWNMAPNYDAILSPRLMTKRGLHLGGLFRLLTANSLSMLNLGYIYNDRVFARFKQDAPFRYPTRQAELARLAGESNNRGTVSFQNEIAYNQHWSSHINYNYASDDYYFQDFGNTPVETTTDQLTQEGVLEYKSQHWYFSGRLLNFQTLHPANDPPVADQYRRLPQLNLNADYPTGPFGLMMQMSSEYVHFDHADLFGATTPTPVVTGDRAYVQPSISYPINSASGYLTPRVQLNAADYALRNQATGVPGSLSRVIPIADLDSGLYFNRDFTLGGNHYVQTLEPRVLYLYVPYKDQSDFPDFDTYLPTITYDELFRTNRFSGEDRIGDANQVAVGLTSRVLDGASGLERMRVSIGFIKYFQERRVTLPYTNGIDFTTGSMVSPIEGQLRYHFNPHWSATADFGWNINLRRPNNTALNFQYRSDQHHIMNIGFTSAIQSPIRNDNLQELTASVYWPLPRHFSALGSVNYNVTLHHATNYFYGLEYDSCCWGVRVIANQILNNTTDQRNEYNKVYYVQFMLKGLTTAGNSDPGDLLKSGIPGYTDNYQ